MVHRVIGFHEVHKTKVNSTLILGRSLYELACNPDLVDHASPLPKATLCFHQLWVNDGFQSVQYIAVEREHLS